MAYDQLDAGDGQPFGSFVGREVNPDGKFVGFLDVMRFYSQKGAVGYFDMPSECFGEMYSDIGRYLGCYGLDVFNGYLPWLSLYETL